MSLPTDPLEILTLRLQEVGIELGNLNTRLTITEKRLDIINENFSDMANGFKDKEAK